MIYFPANQYFAIYLEMGGILVHHPNGVPSDWGVPRPPNIKFLCLRGPSERAKPVVWENLATENFTSTAAAGIFSLRPDHLRPASSTRIARCAPL